MMKIHGDLEDCIRSSLFASFTLGQVRAVQGMGFESIVCLQKGHILSRVLRMVDRNDRVSGSEFTLLPFRILGSSFVSGGLKACSTLFFSQSYIGSHQHFVFNCTFESQQYLLLSIVPDQFPSFWPDG
jgi:hypothetical protein